MVRVTSLTRLILLIGVIVTRKQELIGINQSQLRFVESVKRNWDKCPAQ
jgi:hypothetical protein